MPKERTVTVTFATGPTYSSRTGPTLFSQTVPADTAVGDYGWTPPYPPRQCAS